MANDYYSDSGAPSTGSAGSSATIRAEFASIEAGFDKLADLTGNGSLPVFVNSGATGLEAISASSARTKLGVSSATDTQNQTMIWCGTATGTVNVITLTPTPAITAYAGGQTFRFIASGANTSAVTINVSGLGAVAATKNGSTALGSGDIPAGAMVTINHDGTRFQVTGVVADRVPSASLSALVKAYGLQYSGVTVPSSDTTLTTAHKGGLVIVSGSSGAVTLTMPASATFSNGDGISFLNASSAYDVTLARAGSDQFNPGSAAVNSVTLKPGDTFSCALYGTNWEATCGSAQLAYASIFGSSIASSGYQKLPSGLIIQWGTFTQSDVTGNAVSFTFTHPIAFPIAARQAFVTVGNGNTVSPSVASVEGLNTTTTTGFTQGPTLSRLYRILIIGN